MPAARVPPGQPVHVGGEPPSRACRTRRSRSATASADAASRAARNGTGHLTETQCLTHPGGELTVGHQLIHLAHAPVGGLIDGAGVQADMQRVAHPGRQTRPVPHRAQRKT